MNVGTIARPRWRSTLVTVHLISTLALLGADLALLAVAISGLVGTDPVSVYPAAHVVAAWIVAPLAVTALATGFALAVTSSWGLATYWWIAIKLAITLVLVTLLLLVLIPGLAATTKLPSTLEFPQKLRFVIAPAFASLAVIANSVLGRYKPRWRFRTSEPHLAQE